jgi:hypothetical protein
MDALEDNMLREVSQDQKHKRHVFPHMVKMDPKKHIHTNKHDYIQTDLEHACNSGATLWNSGKGKKKASVISNNIRCEGRGYKDDVY